MSERKYVVPEGMYNAVIEVLPPHVRVQLSAMMGFPGVQRILEAALRWLYDELDSLERKPYDDVLAHEYNACLADVRRMFLAPEEDYADRILKNASPGYTPTHAELDKIWDHIFRAGHGWTPPEMRGASPKAPDPEIPEAVNDLLVKHINSEGALNGPEHKASDARYAHNAAVLEAYRRGQKVGSRA